MCEVERAGDDECKKKPPRKNPKGLDVKKKHISTAQRSLVVRGKHTLTHTHVRFTKDLAVIIFLRANIELNLVTFNGVLFLFCKNDLL